MLVRVLRALRCHVACSVACGVPLGGGLGACAGSVYGTSDRFVFRDVVAGSLFGSAYITAYFALLPFNVARAVVGDGDRLHSRRQGSAHAASHGTDSCQEHQKRRSPPRGVAM